jgi:threonine synthase
MDHRLVCQSCTDEYPPGGYPRGCPTCDARGAAGRLEVTFDPSDVDLTELPFGSEDSDERAERSMWRYQELLPLLLESPVTLGEGWTPVTRLDSHSSETGADVLVKNETINPTWSWKDRLNSLLISNALAEEKSKFVSSSTGNHGASTSAYASRGGADEVVVFLPYETDVPHRTQSKSYGADVFVTDFDARGDLFNELVDRGWYPTTSLRRVGMPYGYEAYKTIAFELVEQLDSVPDAVLVPVGSGDGIYGVWKGFTELRKLGIISSTPRMIGVQPEERCSLVKAVSEDRPSVEPDHGPLPYTTSTSGVIAGEHGLQAVRESGGTAYALSESDVRRSVSRVAREGVLLEPASSLSPGAVSEAYEDGVIERGDTVVCMGSGSGVKWPRKTEAAVGEVPEIEPSFAAFREATDVENI